MLEGIKNSYRFAIKRLAELGLKHSIQEFPSGAIMVDIWVNNLFFVLQFEDEIVGISKIDEENIGFDAIPDEKISTEKEFIDKLELILTGASNSS